MAFVHNVEISWNELMDAFASGKADRVYFLDRFTGEIFFVPATTEDEEFWQQIESNKERFLEIPHMDYGVERKIMSGFIGTVEDNDLKELLERIMTGGKLYGKVTDILTFFPDEHERLMEMKDDYVTGRVKNWLESNDLYTVETEALLMSQM